MKKIIVKLVLYMILLVMVSCSHKIIHLKDNESVSYFVLQSKNADVYYARQKALEISIGLISQERLQSNRASMSAIYNKLQKSNAKLIYVPSQINDTSTKEDVENLFLIELVKDQMLRHGNVKVYNKITNRFENKIHYISRSPKFGDTSETFSFCNGVEFYYHLVEIGE